MAKTNFAALTTHQKKVWSLDFWKMARNSSFINQFAGKGANAMVQRVTELTKTERGDLAVLTLIADLQDDGVIGDYDLEGNEEAIRAYDTAITIDQLRHGNVTTGRMADQKSIVNFREQSRDKLAYFMADRMDQLAFLSLAGVAYTNKTNGAARPVLATGKNLGDLAYAADVTAPSSARHLRWDSVGGDLAAGDTSAVVAADTLSYKALVFAKARAKDEYIRGIRGPHGEEVYHVFVTPRAMAKLKLDSDFLANVRNAGVRGGKNPLFAGTTSVMVDGLIIHEYRHVYNTTGLASGSKWGSASDVDGCRVAICGAQALGMADLGIASWTEETFDYKNRKGIGVDKIFGFLKPVFHSDVTGDNQDFGVMSLDVAI